MTRFPSPEEVRTGVALALTPLGSAPLRRLIRESGSAEVALRRLPREARPKGGISELLAQADREIRDAQAAGAAILVDSDPGYPKLLCEIADRPTALFVRGSLAAVAAVAVVGARRADAYGMRTAERMARELAAAGVTIISGLAHGIDAAAHRGALTAGGHTVAVLGSGLNRIYPSDHGRLAAEIVSAGGAVISEFSMNAGPSKWNFPRRNRIIAGLAQGTLVVEAGLKSGALITARLAIDANRMVWAIPNRIDEELGRGTTALLRSGAVAVEAAEQILEDLAPILERQPKAPARRLEDGKKVDNLIQWVTPDGATPDEIARASGRPLPEVMKGLLRLELGGCVTPMPGGLYRRTGLFSE